MDLLAYKIYGLERSSGEPVIAQEKLRTNRVFVIISLFIIVLFMAAVLPIETQNQRSFLPQRAINFNCPPCTIAQTRHRFLQPLHLDLNTYNRCYSHHRITGRLRWG